MKKIILGLVAAFALASFATPARAEDPAPTTDGAKKDKKAKKGDKKGEAAPAGDAAAPAAPAKK